MTKKPTPAPDEAPQAKKKVVKKELGPKQQRLVRALTTADSVAEAGKIAGYGTRQSTHRAMKSIRRNAVEILEEIGYGQVQALADLREMAGVLETKFWADKGVVMTEREVRALDIQLKARIELNKIHGHYPKDMSDGDSERNHTTERNTVCVVVGDTRAAASLAGLFASRGTPRVVLDVDAEVDKHLG